MDDQTSTEDSFVENAQEWDLNRWTHECAIISPEKLSLLLPFATPEADQDWKKKLHQLFIRLPNSPVESFGRALTSVQFLEILRFTGALQDDNGNRKKITSLFVGISPKVFLDILSQSSQTELAFFREEAVTEPVQHHLSLIAHELTKRFNDLCDQIVLKEREIEGINLQTIGNKELDTLNSQFDLFNKEGKAILNLANRTLAIAWNTNRSDLIQELGRIKELCQKCLIDSIGTMETREDPSTGLYHLMDKKVQHLFSDLDSNGNQTIMKDSTPALEALVKFSVWYIQDYVDVGLLSEAQFQREDVDHDLKNRDQLFMLAEENLGKMGLKTLLDLKNAKIYSKQALKEFIKNKV